jgi:hypothetical protein
MTKVWRILTVTAGVLTCLSLATAEDTHKAVIQPFEDFGCRVGDKVLLPAYSFAARSDFWLPGQQKHCLDTIKRSIVGCSWATRHEHSWNDDKYPGCLPIFRQQAQACAEHYRRQEAVCRAGQERPLRQQQQRARPRRQESQADRHVQDCERIAGKMQPPPVDMTDEAQLCEYARSTLRVLEDLVRARCASSGQARIGPAREAVREMCR